MDERADRLTRRRGVKYTSLERLCGVRYRAGFSPSRRQGTECGEDIDNILLPRCLANWFGLKNGF